MSCDCVPDLTRLNDIRYFGAKCDGVTVDTVAIQTCISLCTMVLIPNTGFPIIIDREILIPSNRFIFHEPGATLKRKAGSLLPGETAFYRNLSYVSGNENIDIYGGIFDGNGANNTRVDVGGYGGGVGFRFRNVTGLRTDSVTIKDPNCFSIQGQGLVRAVFRDTNFEQPYAGTNQDGIHLNGPLAWINVVRTGGQTRDDMVAILANERTQFNMGVSGGDCFSVFIDGVYGGPAGATEAVRLVSGGNAIDGCHINDVDGVFPNGLVRITDENLGTSNITNLSMSNLTGTKHTTGMGAIHFGTSVKTASIINLLQRITNSTTDPIISFESGNTFDLIEVLNANITNATDLKGLIENQATIKSLLVGNSGQEKYSGNKFGAFVNNDGGTIDFLGLRGCRAKNVVSFLKNNGGILRRASIDGCDLEDATNFFEVSGTAATKTRLKTSSNHRTNVTNDLNLNSQPVALNGIDLMVDRTVLTPDTGDIVNDSTDLLKQWDGSAWV